MATHPRSSGRKQALRPGFFARLMRRLIGTQEIIALLEEISAKSDTSALSTKLMDVSSKETKKSFEYPARYAGPHLIKNQIETLSILSGFPCEAALAYAESIVGKELPKGAEGLFASIVVPPEEYEQAVRKVLWEIKDTGQNLAYTTFAGPVRKKKKRNGLIIEDVEDEEKDRITTYEHDPDFLHTFAQNLDERDFAHLGPDRLRQSARSMDFMQRLAEQQHSQIVVFPAQLGLRDANKTPAEVLARIENTDEFGIGFLAGLWMLFLHPERISPEALGLSFIGDKYALRLDQFEYVPCIAPDRFTGQLLELGIQNTKIPGQHLGAVTGFYVK